MSVVVTHFCSFNRRYYWLEGKMIRRADLSCGLWQEIYGAYSTYLVMQARVLCCQKLVVSCCALLSCLLHSI